MDICSTAGAAISNISNVNSKVANDALVVDTGMRCTVSGFNGGFVRIVFPIINLNYDAGNGNRGVLFSHRFINNAAWSGSYSIMAITATNELEFDDAILNEIKNANSKIDGANSNLSGLGTKMDEANSILRDIAKNGTDNSKLDAIKEQQQSTNNKLDEANKKQEETNKKLDEANKTQQETNNKIDEATNTIKDTDTTGASDTASGFFDNFEDDDYGLSDIITAPLSLIQSLMSNACPNMRLTVPFVQENNTFSLPCLDMIYIEHFGSFLTIYRTIVNGFLGYWVVVKIFAMVKGFKDPDDDKIEVMDL